jgi:hypothetical protein
VSVLQRGEAIFCLSVCLSVCLSDLSMWSLKFKDDFLSSNACDSWCMRARAYEFIVQFTIQMFVDAP